MGEMILAAPSGIIASGHRGRKFATVSSGFVRRRVLACKQLNFSKNLQIDRAGTCANISLNELRRADSPQFVIVRLTLFPLGIELRRSNRRLQPSRKTTHEAGPRSGSHSPRSIAQAPG